MPARTITTVVGRSVATISHFARLGLSSMKALEPVATLVRYERSAPRELLHMGTKKLERIEAVGHRITGDRRDHTRGASW